MTDPITPLRVLQVVPGQVGVTTDPETHYTAITGAGVVVCLRDTITKFGGLAYFLFPDGENHNLTETRFGHQAIAVLIQRIVALGGETIWLEAKLFGGAKTHDGRRDIGRRNADYAIRALRRQKIPVLTQSLGGNQVRRVNFSPHRGECEELLLHHGP